LHVIARLPRLESLHFDGEELLIEDIEPLAAAKSLKNVHTWVAATSEERQAFEVAHPMLHVEWCDWQSPSFNPRIPFSDPQYVLEVLLARWRNEDGAGDPELPDLDLRDVRFTRQRLERIPTSSFPTVNHIFFGEVDSNETALDLIAACPNLIQVEAKTVPFNGNDLVHLATHPTIAELRLHYSSLRFPQFMDLTNMRKLESIYTDLSDAPDDEVKQINEVHWEAIRRLAAKRASGDDRHSGK
jgi:hypothetical protein